MNDVPQEPILKRSEHEMTEILDQVTRHLYDRTNDLGSTCKVCHESICKVDGEWIHPHSNDMYCGTGDGAMALPTSFDDLLPGTRTNMKSSVLPMVTVIVNWFDSQPHQPRRGDEVEAWLEREADKIGAEAKDDKDSPPWYRAGEWDGINNLLDLYRLKADAGVALHQNVFNPEEGA